MASIVNDNYKIRIKKGRLSQKNRKNSGKSSEDTTKLVISPSEGGKNSAKTSIKGSEVSGEVVQQLQNQNNQGHRRQKSRRQQKQQQQQEEDSRSCVQGPFCCNQNIGVHPFQVVNFKIKSEMFRHAPN